MNDITFVYDIFEKVLAQPGCACLWLQGGTLYVVPRLVVVIEPPAPGEEMAEPQYA